MKKVLDWQSADVVRIFDEASLWSAPFGRLLLQHIPMKAGMKMLDIGFGSGFPLIELSQRFGEASEIYGIDIWHEAINRAKDKIETLELDNITIFETSASNIPLENNFIDVVTSNLGVNNFDEKEKVYQEIHRVLKPDGRLCITTNPIGTFHQFYNIFLNVVDRLGLDEAHVKIEDNLSHRGNEDDIVDEIKRQGFDVIQRQSDSDELRFVDAMALFNHSLIRIGFRAYWEELIQEAERENVFSEMIDRINDIIRSEGEFRLHIPMLYLEFQKC